MITNDKKFWLLGGNDTNPYYVLCSDNACPCPQVRISNGEGYIYVIDLGKGRVSSNITCEQGARLRKLDLKIAHEDAKYWWKTGLVPFRPTPLKEGFQIAPYTSTLTDKDQEQIRMQERDALFERLRVVNSAFEEKCKYLFVDTETTGLPGNRNAPITNSNNWPRLVQIAWIEFDEAGNEISSSSHIIRPIGYSIPNDATKVHKISNEKAVQEGKELLEVLELFESKIKSSEFLVTHNMEFDEKILLAEYYRIKLPMENLEKIKKICTMRTTTNFCAIPSNYRDYKWPSLSELYFKTFNSRFNESHNAETDIRATAKCFWELKNKGKINWE